MKPASKQPPWRPPTRRAFVAMLGVAAATLAIRTKRKPRAASPAQQTRWIGHV